MLIFFIKKFFKLFDSYRYIKPDGTALINQFVYRGGFNFVELVPQTPVRRPGAALSEIVRPGRSGGKEHPHRTQPPPRRPHYEEGVMRGQTFSGLWMEVWISIILEPKAAFCGMDC